MEVHLDGIQTDRLYFTPLKTSMLETFMPFFSSKEALQHMIIPDDPEAFGREWIERQIGRYQEQKAGLLALAKKEDNTIIGMCGFIWQWVDGQKELEVGYHLIPDYWGFGYASEAAIEARDYGFQHNLANSIISIIVTTNIPSQKVARRNGMEIDFRTKHKGFDVDIFRISRDQWEKIKIED